MFAVTKLKRKLIISPQEVIDNIASDNDLNHAQVLQAIPIAEERFIRPALGMHLFDLIRLQKNIEVNDGNKGALQIHFNRDTAGNQPYELKVGDIINAAEMLSVPLLRLWNDHICKYAAECVRFIALGDNYAQFTNAGIMKNNPAAPIMPGGGESTSASIELRDIKWLLDYSLNQKITPLADAMHAYIMHYKSDYPQYDRLYTGGETMLSAWVPVRAYAEEDGDYEECCRSVHTPTAPATDYLYIKKMERFEFATVPNQMKYPYPGMENEFIIRNKLKAAALMSFSQEGIDLTTGPGDGQMLGLDPVLGEVVWNSPAPETGLRCILVVETRIL